MNQNSPIVTYGGEPVSFAADFLTIPPTPSRTSAAFVIPSGPLSEQLRGMARQVATRIEAGHYRRLPVCERSGLRLLALVLDQMAERAAIVEDLTPPVRARKWWRFWK